MGINRLYWGGSSGSGFLLTLRSTTPVFLLLNIPNIFLSKPLPTESQKQQNSALETDLAAIGLVSLPGLLSFIPYSHDCHGGVWGEGHLSGGGTHGAQSDPWRYVGQRGDLYDRILGVESVGGRWLRPGRVADMKNNCAADFASHGAWGSVLHIWLVYRETGMFGRN